MLMMHSVSENFPMEKSALEKFKRHESPKPHLSLVKARAVEGSHRGKTYCSCAA